MRVKEVGEGGGGGVCVEGRARRCRGGVCVGDECVYARGRRGNAWVRKGGGGGVGVEEGHRNPSHNNNSNCSCRQTAACTHGTDTMGETCSGII